MSTTIEEIKDLIKLIAERQAKTDEQLARTDAQLAKTDEQLARTDARLAKLQDQLSITDKKLLEASRIITGIGINLGHTAEEFFYEALKEKPILGNIKFDTVKANVYSVNKEAEGEFDILMFNGNAAAIIEIKHKVHPNDIDELITKKVENFKKLFPAYKNDKLYLGIGGMSVPESVAQKARELGIAVLRQKGELAKIDAKSLKAY